MPKSLRRDGDLSLLNSEMKDFEEKVQVTMPLELRYTCRYGTGHLSRITRRDKAVVRALKDFLIRSLLWWFEAMSLISNVFIVASSIQ